MRRRFGVSESRGTSFKGQVYAIAKEKGGAA
jgi:hypothetical protein